MNDPDVLRRILSLLRGAGIPHMITGSLASSTYGEPRSTQDLDVVVDPTPLQLDVFLSSLDPAAYYFSREAAVDAMARRSMFNVIDFETGWKIDLIVLKANPHEQVKFSRRVTTDVLGQPADMVTPEDSILSKLEWRKESGSDRQFRDAVQVAANRWKELDTAYLRHSAHDLNLTIELEQLLHDADELRNR